jgi:hypothetical protein
MEKKQWCVIFQSSKTGNEKAILVLSNYTDASLEKEAVEIFSGRFPNLIGDYFIKKIYFLD